jgi:hypothetical protein
MIISKVKTSLLVLAFVLYTTLFTTSSFAATASFGTSGGGTVYTGNNITVTVTVTGSEAYNAVSATTTFTNLTYVGASVTGGWTGVAGPSVSGNTVNFSGANLGGSFTGTRNVMFVTFRTPSTPGVSTIRSSGSIALANGSGTLVSGGGNTVTYNVITPPTPTPTPKPAAGLVSISSTTNPDQNTWYKTKEVALQWVKEAGVTDFSYELNSTADTTPDETTEGSDITKTYPDMKDGTSYFHIKAKNDVGWGAVSHFKINVDSTAPNPFCIVGNKEDTGEVSLYFATNDSASGIEKYMLKVDDADIGAQISGYKVSKDVKKVIITAYDNAGNTKESTINLNGETTNKCEQQSSQVVTSNTSNKEEGKKNSKFNQYTILFMITTLIGLTYSAIVSYLYIHKLHAVKKAIGR